MSRYVVHSVKMCTVNIKRCFFRDALCCHCHFSRFMNFVLTKIFRLLPACDISLCPLSETTKMSVGQPKYRLRLSGGSGCLVDNLEILAAIIAHKSICHITSSIAPYWHHDGFCIHFSLICNILHLPAS